jgi:hypothetical protein
MISTTYFKNKKCFYEGCKNNRYGIFDYCSFKQHSNEEKNDFSICLYKEINYKNIVNLLKYSSVVNFEKTSLILKEEDIKNRDSLLAIYIEYLDNDINYSFVLSTLTIRRVKEGRDIPSKIEWCRELKNIHEMYKKIIKRFEFNGIIWSRDIDLQNILYIKLKETNICDFFDIFGVFSMKFDEGKKSKIPLKCLNCFDTFEPCINNVLSNNVSTCSCRSKTVKEATCMKTYGVSHHMKTEECKIKSKETCMKTYGFSHPMKSEEVKTTLKKSFINSIGVDNPMKNEECKMKSKETCIKRYGVPYAMQSEVIKAQLKKVLLAKHGVDNCFKLEDTKSKIRKTLYERYGVYHPLQYAEFAEKALKNSYKKKEFKFPCGNIIICQGYEPRALNYLVSKGYTYKDFITERTKIPEIWYIQYDITHRYYCDIFIPKENRIIEVKSNWTYQNNIEITRLKGIACINAGYNFELWIFDIKGKLTILKYGEDDVDPSHTVKVGSEQEICDVSRIVEKLNILNEVEEEKKEKISKFKQSKMKK